ncbi:ribosomal protein L11 methyltransferase [[Clostridium] methylpentosum DSM 5476]|uniref:Ribosomal protein L11 methyltransferase n=1 Tax=[Clostridium] methylpentosum DSM 5476 TaxID=537013 RepID=C0EA00_9FIRM|nr:ribosomal protein L11 methyltransferase [[Clostridium] methylpentosum DSM 5476]MDY3988012.1 50S ribosomal protein L11 methyltransferase [Massilioclostridium sp.]MEE1490632.1 50S ribosomal protein L11 methyltransferase [Massilioclostridium sp.]
MDWTEIKVSIPCEQVDEASAIAQMVVPYGIYIEDYSGLEEQVEQIAHIDLIDEELLQKDRSRAIIHIYIEPDQNPLEAVSFLENRLSIEGIPYQIGTDSVDQEEWATAWQKYYHPIQVGKRVVICPEWEECSIQPDEVKVTLNPGMAFGTGTHETTRLCMQFLEEYVTPSSTILDVGCGSGILSITGLLLGARHAVGVDIDELAVKVAGENAALNRITEEQAEFLCGDLTEQVSGQYDIICANIVADVIIKLCETVTQFMHKDSVLLCSGIIDQREDDVLLALSSAGLNVLEIKRENGWVAISCKL